MWKKFCFFRTQPQQFDSSPENLSNVAKKPASDLLLVITSLMKQKTS
jgi:acyl-CoA-binding protein